MTSVKGENEIAGVAPGGATRPPTLQPQFLFVDDNAPMTRVIQRVASTCGLEVCATTSAEAFVAKYRELAPDLIGFDLAMPNADGVELMRFLAAEGCRAPILIVTGHDHRVLAAAVRLGRERGLNIAASLAKPFMVQELRETLDRMRELALVGLRGEPV